MEKKRSINLQKPLIVDKQLTYLLSEKQNVYTFT